MTLKDVLDTRNGATAEYLKHVNHTVKRPNLGMGTLPPTQTGEYARFQALWDLRNPRMHDSGRYATSTSLGAGSFRANGEYGLSQNSSTFTYAVEPLLVPGTEFLSNYASRSQARTHPTSTASYTATSMDAGTMDVRDMYRDTYFH